MVVGLIPTFLGDNTDALTVMDRRLELLHVEHRGGGGGDGVGRDMTFPSGLSRALIDEAQHAFHDEPAGFVAHHGPLDPGLPTAFSVKSCRSIHRCRSKMASRTGRIPAPHP